MLKTVMKLTRIEHSFMLIFAVVVSIIALNLQVPLEYYIYLFSCPFFISAGAFALNDYFDVDSDRINNKKTPIVMGKISKQNALILSILFLFIGIIISIPLGYNAVLIAILFALLSIAYNYKLKDVALIGNIIISMSMGIVFIFTEISMVNTITITSIFMGVTSLFSGLGREIYKTVQDVKGDIKARKSKTLPVYIGENNSIHLGTLFVIVAILCAVYMYLSVPPMKGNYAYLIVAIPSFILFFKAIYLVYKPVKEYNKIKNIMLKAMVLGLISFLISGFFML